jgi:hypothetical protein
VLALRILHWPPKAGLVVEITFRWKDKRTPTFVYSGPVRELRERAYVGSLWRLDLTDISSLPKRLALANILSTGSAVGFAVTLTVILAHLHDWPILSYPYWASLLVAISFEGIFISNNELRKQIVKKVSAPLAYWLRRPYQL